MSATRLRRPTVKDPRLVVGILLVALSVWLGVWAVDNAKDLSVAYVAAQPIVAGQAVTQEHLRPVEVNLAAQGSQYVSVPLDADHNYIATTTIGEGQFVPTGSLVRDQAYATRVIAISTSTVLPRNVTVGATVELWAAPKAAASGDDPAPTLVATDLVVAQLPATDQGFSASSGQTVHVVVSAEQVSDVVAASMGDMTLSLLSYPKDES